MNEVDWFTGETVGGTVCSVLTVLASLGTIPLMLNTFFSGMVWQRDWKKGETSALTAALVMFQVYPQWKGLKLLALFFTDPPEVDRQKNQVSVESTIEAFTEAAIQVRQIKRFYLQCSFVFYSAPQYRQYFT